MLYRILPFFFFAFLFNFGCQGKEDVKTITVAHGLDVNHSVHQALIFLGRELERESGGKFKVKIFPNQQLGTERECLELLQIGSIGITKVSTAILENFAPKFKVFSLPYIFNDRGHQFRVLDGPIGHELLSEAEKFQLKGLCFYDAGARSFYTKSTGILGPDNLRGLKIRTQESTTAISMMQFLGSSATPISWGELYTALQQGIVDGAENNLPSYFLSRHFEVCPHYSFNEHAMVPDMLLISLRVWESLNTQEQQWLKEAANASVAFQRKTWAKNEQVALTGLRTAGVSFYYPDKDLFFQKVAPIWKENLDEDLNLLVKKINDLREVPIANYD